MVEDRRPPVSPSANQTREALLDACTAARPRGRIVVLGVCGKPDQFLRIAAVLKEPTMRFSVGYLPWEFTTVIEAYACGHIDPTPMLGRRFGLVVTADAFEHTASGLDGKVLVCP